MTPSLGKGSKPSTRRRASRVFVITAAMVITIGVRESLRERSVAVVTALTTTIGIEAANN